ncbi:glycerate kinase family protein [Agilicoccus flavus]|uniref:glycerate kinase family protein n=1 Tax=Agilicoccus flavus TaxID=2775968 RepID=UPI001CF6D4AD|nr:glycerate kinase [Agilicoccus flavus]
MRVLVCPRSFAGTLTAVQAAQAIAAGWSEAAPDDEMTLAPLSGGGPGFVGVVEAALSGMVVATTVADPLGRDVPASLLRVDSGGVRTVYVEAAQAAGLHLLAAHERDPERTGTYGVGQLVDAALAEGADRIVVGVGGTATNDAGAGMLAALGLEDPALRGGGAALAALGDESLVGLRELRARVHGVDLVVAVDDQAPLLGFSGTSATHAVAKGASPEAAQRLERALGRFVDVADRALPPATDLLTGLPRRPEREPGAGAGGGLAYGLGLLGARRASAVDVVLEACGMDERLARTDLVVTGEGCFDHASLRDSVVSGVSAAAARRGLPVVVLAGRVEVGRRESMSIGVAGTYAVAARPGEVEASMADPVGTLRARARRLARTWSPR